MLCDVIGKLLGDHAEQSIEICRELVRRPSEDPPGDTREVAAFINDFFQKNNIESQIISPHPEKPSVVATITGKHPGGHVVFNGHIDTFPAGDKTHWIQNPFDGDLIDGKIYGRGVADMKGGMAASMTAALILNLAKDHLPGRISVTCVSDEEVNGPWGTNYLLENYPDLYGDALINGEPSSIEHIRIGEKGIHQVRVVIHTAGGHGAYAGLKANAIVEMNRLIASLLNFENEAPEMDAGVRRMMESARESYDNVLGCGAMDAAQKPSLNVGTINGGIMVNMVPEKCEVELDFRLPPGIRSDFVKEWLTKKLKKYPGSVVEFIKSMDSHLTSPEHPLVRIAKESAEEVCERPVYENYSIGGTEACLWRLRGVPAVTYGPNHHNMGSPDEYIYASELPIVTKVQALTAWKFLHYLKST